MAQRIYGYCRISTPQQSIDRQIRNILAEYPNAEIITESYTGTKMHRPAWDRLLKQVQPGDWIVFDSVSRMSRTADEGWATYKALKAAGIDLIFLKEPHINTATYQKALQQSVPMTGTAVDCILEGINKYLTILAEDQVRMAFSQAEKEVQDLRQRTAEGIETARRNGKQIGQLPGSKLHSKKADQVKQVILKYSQDFGGILSDVDCMKLAGCARNTFYKYKKELRQTAGSSEKVNQ